ncbi:MAG: beta-hexosaminidase, partial [Mesorhizobium sp.]
MSESKSMILGCAGKSLTEDEVRFYRNERPWGFILFARNIGGATQIRDLVAAMRDCV